MPLEHRQTIHDWVDELLKKEAIKVSWSTDSSPIFLLPKPHSQGMHAVLDYHAVNLKSKPDRYTIREIHDCIDEIRLAESNTFTTIDLTSRFWQQVLNKRSRPLTSFTVPGKGTRYQWTVTPMGLQGSLASFARLINYVFQGIKGVVTYIDNVLTHSKGHEEQLRLLEETLLCLQI